MLCRDCEMDRFEPQKWLILHSQSSAWNMDSLTIRHWLKFSRVPLSRLSTTWSSSQLSVKWRSMVEKLRRCWSVQSRKRLASATNCWSYYWQKVRHTTFRPFGVHVWGWGAIGTSVPSHPRLHPDCTFWNCSDDLLCFCSTVLRPVSGLGISTLAIKPYCAF